LRRPRARLNALFLADAIACEPKHALPALWDRRRAPALYSLQLGSRDRCR
jgi:hypothetical protein